MAILDLVEDYARGVRELSFGVAVPENPFRWLYDSELEDDSAIRNHLDLASGAGVTGTIAIRVLQP
ncbi:hypothetical protein LTR56_028160, partial [Elasticomyces elasticus]